METTTFIDLLRHGETVGDPGFRGSTDDPLSPAGWRQMEAATEGLCAWDHIISSPLRRCQEFAAALAQRCGTPLTTNARLAEMHFGTWEGRTAAELGASDPDALARFWSHPAEYPPPEAEPLPAFALRVLTAWDHILRNHPGQRGLLLTHGGVIRVILCHVLNRPVERLLELDVGYASLHRIRAERDGQGTLRATLVGEAPP